MTNENDDLKINFVFLDVLYNFFSVVENNIVLLICLNCSEFHCPLAWF